MRRLLPLFLALLLAAPADAQRRQDREDRVRREEDRDAFGRDGAFALAFQAGWLFVGPFLGGAGGRYWVTDQTVLTASLRAGAFTADQDPSGDGDQPDEENDGYQLGLSAAVERHFGRSRRVSPFVALGTDFTAYRDENENTFPDGGRVRSARRTTAVGGSVFVGAEYRFAPGLTLGAAHALGASYEWGTFVNEQDFPEGEPTRIEQDLSVFRFGTSTTTLTLSVYF